MGREDRIPPSTSVSTTENVLGALREPPPRERRANILVTKMVANRSPRIDIEWDKTVRSADFLNTNQYLSTERNRSGRPSTNFESGAPTNSATGACRGRSAATTGAHRARYDCRQARRSAMPSGHPNRRARDLFIEAKARGGGHSVAPGGEYATGQAPSAGWPLEPLAAHGDCAGALLQPRISRSSKLLANRLLPSLGRRDYQAG
jgi:hypothetical protein